jgi:hypothetical protein
LKDPGSTFAAHGSLTALGKLYGVARPVHVVEVAQIEQAAYAARRCSQHQRTRRVVKEHLRTSDDADGSRAHELDLAEVDDDVPLSARTARSII